MSHPLVTANTPAARLQLPAAPRSVGHDSPVEPHRPSISNAPGERAHPFQKILPSALGWLLIALLCWIFLTGCARRVLSNPVIGPFYTPENVYRSAPVLPDHFRRVAVLPIVPDPRTPETEDGARHFQEALHSQVTQSQVFEVLSVPGSRLQHWFGKSVWSADENLPATFFERLRAETGCDGVLFAKLTVFRPYPPLSIGWNLKLIDAKSPSVWWAADVVFNAGDPAVANSARRFHQRRLSDAKTVTDADIMLNSPLRFAHYSLAALMETLPDRAPAQTAR